MVYENNPLKTI